MNDFIIPLDANSKEPMYEQIYCYIKSEIINGNLPFHSRLPSTRALARHMQISRSTVDMAYAQLTAEGYLESIPCKGYFVAPIEELYVAKQEVQTAKRESLAEEPSCHYDFSPRGIDLENFPYNIWGKITKNVLSEQGKSLFEAGHSKGDYTLRQAICTYLHQARGVSCLPEQMIIGAGNEYLLMLLHQLLPQECTIAMENPTYKQAYHVFHSLGHPVLPIEMDEQGMAMEKLAATNASLAYVMPSHQFPLGIVMPIKRRMEMLAWAEAEQERYIIEDDYDSEFRYRGKPIPSLQSVDREGKVIYLGTFSRSIAPAIRISFMVLPERLMERYSSVSFYSSTVSRVDQAILNVFLREGYFERHLNRMRSIYKSKHDLMLNELRALKNFEIEGENAGIHILLKCRQEKAEEVLVQEALMQGVRVYGLSRYYISSREKYRATVLLGYANMSEEDIRNGIKRLRSWGGAT